MRVAMCVPSLGAILNSPPDRPWAKSAMAPDHLVTQVEFLASVRYLQNCGKPAAEILDLRNLERDYLERHLLSWIPDAMAALQRLRPPIFPLLFMLLLQFLHLRHDTLS
jgi:TorA maturation chaperone TorD